jgi:hypothetical protein
MCAATAVGQRKAQQHQATQAKHKPAQQQQQQDVQQ